MRVRQHHLDRFSDEKLQELIAEPLLGGREIPFVAHKLIQYRKDPFLWMVEQVYTRDETRRGVFPFPDFQYLKETVNLLRKKETEILTVLKARRLLLSHLASALAAWYLLFTPYSNVFIVSTTQDKAQRLFRDRVRFILEYLDPRFDPDPNNESADIDFGHIDLSKNITKSEVYNPRNGSQVVSLPSGADKIRGETATLAIYDEFAFQDNCDENMRALLAALQGEENKGLIISTPKAGTVFEELCKFNPDESSYTKVCEGFTTYISSAEYLVAKIHYTAHPDRRTKEWYMAERYGRTVDGEKIPGKKRYLDHNWMMEQECSFDMPMGSQIFPNTTEEHAVEYEKFTKGMLVPGAPVTLSFDFGNNRPCCAIMQCFVDKYGDNNKVIIHNAYIGDNISFDRFLDDVCEWLDETYPAWNTNFEIACDPAGYNTNSQGRAMPVAFDLERFFNKKTINGRRQVPVGGGILRLQRLLSEYDKDGVPSVVINPAGGILVDYTGIKETGVIWRGFTSGYCWQEKKVSNSGGKQKAILRPQEDDLYEHPMDCIRYVIVSKYGYIRNGDLRFIEDSKPKKPKKKRPLRY